jgi:hypothetical protein
MIQYSATIYLPKKSNEGEFSRYLVDNQRLISFEISIFDREDINYPSFGIISNTGKLEFIDNHVDISIREYAELQLLKENLRTDCYLQNTRTGKEEKQAEMFTSNWHYDAENKICSVDLKDNLQDWQNINITLDKIDVSKETKSDAWSLFLKLQSKTPNGEKFFVDEETEQHLKSLQDNIVYFTGGNLWNVWNRFCFATQTHIFSDIYNSNSVVRIKYNGGN